MIAQTLLLIMTVMSMLGLMVIMIMTTDRQLTQVQSTTRMKVNEAVTQANEPNIYSGSLLSSTTSNLTICSFICCHQLSKQAQEDLLQLTSNKKFSIKIG